MIIYQVIVKNEVVAEFYGKPAAIDFAKRKGGKVRFNYRMTHH